MNKLRILILLIVAVVILSTTVIYGADPGPVLNFNDEAEIEEIALPEHDCTADWEDGIYTVVSTNESGDGDPYIAYTMDIDADTYTWAKFRIKNLSDCTTFEFHFNPNNTGIAASSKVHFTMTANDTDWKEYVVNIPEANVETVNSIKDATDISAPIDETTWVGPITEFRLDFMWVSEPSGQVPEGSTMLVDYVAFFESEEDANAYQGPPIITPAPVTPTPIPTPTPTIGPSVTAKAVTPTTSSDNASFPYYIFYIVGGVIVIAVVAAVVVIVRKKKKTS